MSEDMFRTVGRTDGRRSEKRTAVSCWPDAAPFTRFSFASPSKKVTEFVALIEIPSKRKEKKKRVVPDRSERESKNSKSELDFESELQQGIPRWLHLVS